MEEKNINISVIIPTFNSGRFLAKTLAAVAKQDYLPFEVIVVDGGSSDETLAVINAYGSFVTQFISEPDKGQLDAVQKGIQLAKGDILYWLNADDIVMPGVFKSVANAFLADPTVDYVFGDNYWFEEESRRFGVGHSVRWLSFWDQFLFYGQLQVEAFFWRRELSVKALPFDTNLRVYTDYSFFLPVRYGAKGKWINQRLGAFRVHAEQMSTVNHALGDSERELVKQRMCDRLNISKVQFDSLRKKHKWYFLFKHKFFTKITSGIRYLGRKLSGDYFRNKTASYFFDEWLKPPTNQS